MYLNPTAFRFLGDHELDVYMFLVMPLFLLLILLFNAWKMGKFKRWKPPAPTPRNNWFLSVGVVGTAVLIGAIGAIFTLLG